jgi:hypothetical protein
MLHNSTAGRSHAPVVLGEKDDHPILAVVTLEILRLSL